MSENSKGGSEKMYANSKTTHSILVVRDICIMPISGNKKELAGRYGAEMSDLEVFPKEFIQGFKLLNDEIDSVLSSVKNITECNSDKAQWARIALRYESKHRNYVFAEMIDESWFSENGKQNGIYRTCFRVGQAFGYHISGDCAVKLINTICDDNNSTQFKFYLTK